MTQKQKLIILLVLGFIFSSMIGIKLSSGLNFEGFWHTLIPIKLADVVGKNSTETILNICLPGYIFYLIFGVATLKRQLKEDNNKASIVLFIALVTYILSIEMRFIYSLWNNSYNGRHIYIGLPIFLYGLVVLLKAYRKK